MTAQPQPDANLQAAVELGKKIAQRAAQYAIEMGAHQGLMHAAFAGMLAPAQSPERFVTDIQKAARNALTTRNYAALSRAETELDYYGGDQ